VVVSYDPTIYQGAAAHYRHGRPAYSPQLEAVLAEELDLDGSGRLLDAGCGPGILTVRLANLFAEAVGLDPDSAMIAEGRRVAQERGITNIRWVQARAEELPGAAPGPYRLVTFGQSFWWTDEARVADAVYDMLEPAGALALIVHTVEGRSAPPSPGPPPIPHAEINRLLEKYLGTTQRAGQGVKPVRTHRFEDVLARTPFGKPRSVFAPGIPDLLRDSESVLSGYFSMASSAPHLFGDRVDDFASEVRELLRSRSAEGIFWDWPGDTEVTLARKRARGTQADHLRRSLRSSDVSVTGHSSTLGQRAAASPDILDASPPHRPGEGRPWARDNPDVQLTALELGSTLDAVRVKPRSVSTYAVQPWSSAHAGGGCWGG
jgi:SAM-dependent methyltransferase